MLGDRKSMEMIWNSLESADYLVYDFGWAPAPPPSVSGKNVTVAHRM